MLPISFTIQSEQDSSPEYDDMGLSTGQILMDKPDRMEELDLEVSGTMSNTCGVLPTDEDAWLLEEIRNSMGVKEKVATIDWPEFGESPISEYWGGSSFCMLFP
jgi:hypothetical protein